MPWAFEAFVLAAMIDIPITLHMRRVAQGKAWSAAFYSALIAGISGIITLIYVHVGLLAIIPTAAGAFVGTLATVWLDSRG